MESEPRYEQHEAEAAASEAARIGGVAGDEAGEPAHTIEDGRDST
jgi:hypothetical protein